jgi:hypothetical protein
MKEVTQEPATPAEALETIPDGVDPEAYKHCLEYYQAQGVNLDTFKFIEVGLDKLCIMLKKPKLKLSRCIDDAFAVPDVEVELASESSLELADASVTMIYKVCMVLSDFICKFGSTSLLIYNCCFVCFLLCVCVYIYIDVIFCRMLFYKGVCVNLLKKMRRMQHFARKFCLRRLNL